MLHAFHHVFLHGLCLIELGVLGQVAHGVTRAPYYMSLILLVYAGDDFHQG